MAMRTGPIRASGLIEARDAIVRATLPHVPFDGWNLAALKRGAAEAGYEPGKVAQLFPGGAIDAVEHFSSLADRLMIADMAERDLEAMKVSERVALGVRLRLERWTLHREAVRRALGLLALPVNAGVAARCTWRTVDAIWQAAGDVATDFSFYSKRATLAAVYVPTVFYWLDDRSEGTQESWAFLQRRLADVMRLPRMRAEARRRLSVLPNPWLLFDPNPQPRRRSRRV